MFSEMKAALKDLRHCVQEGVPTYHRHGVLFFGQKQYSITSTVPSDRKKSSKEYSLGEIWLFVVMNLFGGKHMSPMDTREFEAIVAKYRLKPITDARVQSTIESSDSLQLFFTPKKADTPQAVVRPQAEEPSGERQSRPSSSSADNTCLIEEEINLDNSQGARLGSTDEQRRVRLFMAQVELPRYLREIQEQATPDHIEDLRRIREQEMKVAPCGANQNKIGSFKDKIEQLDCLRKRGLDEGFRKEQVALEDRGEIAMLVPNYAPKNLLNFSNCEEFFESGVLNLADFSSQQGPPSKSLRFGEEEEVLSVRVFSSLKLLASQGLRYVAD